MSITIQDPRNKFVGGTIEFIYDASGAKLRKIVTPSALNGGQPVTYDYINGVEYKNGTLDRVNHTEGAVVRNENGVYQHEYVLRDHLGNTRVTFRDGVNQGDPYEDWLGNSINPNAGNGYNDGVVTTADIKQINNYYPFGLNMEGNWNGAAGSNKYGYNGKEWNDDFGLGWNDYGARMYDPSVARWVTVDPLSEKHTSQTAYNYVSNNPIKMIDPDGRDGILIIDKKNHLITVRVNYNWSSNTHQAYVEHGISNNFTSNSSWKESPGAHESWSSKERTVKIGKTDYTVKYEVQVNEHPTHKEAAKASRERGSNFLTVRDGPRGDKKMDSYVSGNSMDLNSKQMQNDANTFSHEIIHSLGVGHNTYSENGIPTISSYSSNADIINRDVYNTVSSSVELANSLEGNNITVYLRNGEIGKPNQITVYSEDGEIRKQKEYKKTDNEN